MKIVRLTILLVVIAAGITGCVAPYYGTARIEPGWNLNTGVGLHSTILPLHDGPALYGIGLRCDTEIGYGLNDYWKPYARAGFGLNTAYIGFADIGAGMHIALPVWIFTPAIKLEINSAMLQPTFSPAVLLGIGKQKLVTFGAKWYLSAFADPVKLRFGDLFITVHPSPRWSVFASIEFPSFIGYLGGFGYPFFTLGVGYKMPSY